MLNSTLKLREPEKKLIAPARVPTGVSLDFANFLGSYAGTVAPGTKPQEFNFGGRCKEELTRLKSTLSKLRGTEVPILESPAPEEGEKNYKLSLCSSELMNYVSELTGKNTRIPWEHVLTPQEHIHWLRGCFDRGGSVTRTSGGCVEFMRENGYPLILDMARLLVRFGITPLVYDGTPARLRIHQTRDLVKFKETIGFNSLDKTSRFNELLRNREEKPRREGYSVDDYERVMTYKPRNDLTYGEISRLTNVKKDAVQQWLRDGQCPDSVVRLKLIQKETEHYPDPSIVGYLFRKRGAQFDSQEARHIACYVDEKDLLPLLGRARDTMSDFSDLIRELCAARMAIPSHELEVIPLNETARITA